MSSSPAQARAGDNHPLRRSSCTGLHQGIARLCDCCQFHQNQREPARLRDGQLDTFMQRSRKLELKVRPPSFEGPKEYLDSVPDVSVNIWSDSHRLVYSLNTTAAALDATTIGITPPWMVVPWIRTCRVRILKRKIVRHCATSSRILPLASRPSHSIMHGQRPPHVRHVRRNIQPTHLQRGRCGRKPCSSITVHSPSFDCGRAKVRTPTCERALKQLPVSCESADGYFHDVQFALNSDRIGAPDDQAAAPTRPAQQDVIRGHSHAAISAARPPVGAVPVVHHRFDRVESLPVLSCGQSGASLSPVTPSAIRGVPSTPVTTPLR